MVVVWALAENDGWITYGLMRLQSGFFCFCSRRKRRRGKKSDHIICASVIWRTSCDHFQRRFGTLHKAIKKTLYRLPLTGRDLVTPSTQNGSNLNEIDKFAVAYMATVLYLVRIDFHMNSFATQNHKFRCLANLTIVFQRFHTSTTGRWMFC